MSRTIALLGLIGVLDASTAVAQPPPSLPPPYSLPWLLRPVSSGTVVRLDSTRATFQDAAGRSGSTFVESLSVSYKATPRLAPLFRVSYVNNKPLSSGVSGRAVSNALMGVNYVKPLGGLWRGSLFGATTLPIGSGGGESPSAGAAAAVQAAVPVRSAMDNALFAVNYWTVVAGVGVARVTPALTLQAEATVLQLIRVRGPLSQDASRTNLTAGVHLGHFFSKRFSVGGELRVQRWITNALPVRRDPRATETVTVGLGSRLHFKVGKRTLRPGLSWSRALDQPLRSQRYNVLQLDVPIVF